MKKSLLIFSIALGILTFSSCKKCYLCVCTDTTTPFGCTQAGQTIEICDKGAIGKTILSVRKVELESEGFTCNVK